MLEAKDLIQGLLRVKPEERLSLPDVLTHPWLKEDTLEDATYLSKEECMNPMQPCLKQADINSINVDNLFFEGRSQTKLSYTDYCYIANDFYTQHLSTLLSSSLSIDEDALRSLEKMGSSRAAVIDSLQKGDLNHAVASYNLLVLP